MVNAAQNVRHIPTTTAFGEKLRRYRMRAGLSQNKLAGLAGINASFINRLEAGERETASPEVVRSMARSLNLPHTITDQLLAYAGHCPNWLMKLGPEDSTVTALVTTLTNDRLSPEARADLRACIEAMCARWVHLPAIPAPHHVRELPSAAPGRVHQVKEKVLQ